MHLLFLDEARSFLEGTVKTLHVVDLPAPAGAHGNLMTGARQPTTTRRALIAADVTWLGFDIVHHRRSLEGNDSFQKSAGRDPKAFGKKLCGFGWK